MVTLIFIKIITSENQIFRTYDLRNLFFFGALRARSFHLSKQLLKYQTSRWTSQKQLSHSESRLRSGGGGSLTQDPQKDLVTLINENFSVFEFLGWRLLTKKNLTNLVWCHLLRGGHYFQLRGTYSPFFSLEKIHIVWNKLISEKSALNSQNPNGQFILRGGKEEATEDYRGP